MPQHWTIYRYAETPAAQITMSEVRLAYLSASDSGHIYWDHPAPLAYVRGAVHESNGKLVAESQRRGGMDGDFVISVNPPFLSPREREEAQHRVLRGRWLYAGSWMYGFGHFLIETLPTLWPLLDEQANFDGIAAHRFNFNQVHSWQNEIVGLIFAGGIEIVREGPMRVENLTVPVRPSQYKRSIAPIAARVWDTVAANAGEGGRRPVYLSRTLFEENMTAKGVDQGRKYSNSSAVDDLFRARGFDVLFPESMSATDQIRAVKTAPIVAGQSGSALHLAAFNQGGKILEIGDRRTPDAVLSAQQAISFAKNQLVAKVPYEGDGNQNLDLNHLVNCLDTLGI
ncbi:glycosyltransferase family 61 protein [Arthrobacter sp. MDT1-48-3]